MGVGRTFADAYAKAQLGAGITIPSGGKAFLSVRDADKSALVAVAKSLIDLGFSLIATHGTARYLEQENYPCEHINKVGEGRPHIVDMITNGQIDFIINTTEGKKAIADSCTIRSKALQHKVPYTTTIAGGAATCMAMELLTEATTISRLQDLHQELAR